MRIISRSDAKAAGLARYFTGKPCKRGHVSERYTCGAACCMCAFLCQKEWVVNNRDRFNEVYRDWMKCHPEVRKAKRQKWKSSPHGKRNQRKHVNKRKRRMYFEGPLNPEGEAQWLNKSKALHRKLKRLLRQLEAPLLPSGE